MTVLQFYCSLEIFSLLGENGEEKKKTAEEKVCDAISKVHYEAQIKLNCVRKENKKVNKPQDTAHNLWFLLTTKEAQVFKPFSSAANTEFSTKNN